VRDNMTMSARIRHLLTAPVFEGDEDKTRVASLVNTILLSALTVAALAACFLPLVELPLTGAIVIGIWMAITLSALWLLRAGRVRLSSALLTGTIWLFSTTMILLSGGIGYSPAASYVTITILASLLLGGRAALTLAGLSVVVGLGFLYAELNDLLPPPMVYIAPAGRFIGLVVNISMAGVLLYLAARGIFEALARARTYAAELEGQRAHLEQTVEARIHDLARRARYLEATAAIARDAASVLDVRELLSRVVGLIGVQFGFYHVGLFLIDPAGEWTVLQAASSAGGQRMLARQHRLRVGVEGIVGYVAGRGVHRLALDVDQDAVSFDNPDLPDTRSEMALPLRARGEIIGVLDVQSTEPAAFTEEDVTVLQTLADQVAIAISNAQLFEQAQQSLEADRRAYGELSHEAWRELLRAQPALGVLSQAEDVVPIGNLWRPEMDAALRTGQVVPGDEGTMTLAVPLKVRDRVIGVVDGRKPRDSGAWTTEEIQLLEELTEQVGLTLESARLYQDSQRRAAREQLTGEITARMRETLDVDTVLKTAVREIGEALGLHDVTIRLETDADQAG